MNDQKWQVILMTKQMENSFSMEGFSSYFFLWTLQTRLKLTRCTFSMRTFNKNRFMVWFRLFDWLNDWGFYFRKR